MAATHSVKVLLFAGARQLAGTAEASYPWVGMNLDEARAELARQFGPEFGRLLASCALWVNAEPAPGPTVLTAGDEVAVLPPVSGG